MKPYDSSAIGSDIPRSFKQYIARKFAQGLVRVLGLNKASFLATEIVQQISPICVIPTEYGDIRCRAGHGRLRWRAVTFYTEEPYTINWLESLKKDDYLWDIGANVGLYSIYAAKCAKCKILAIEPEAQNFAILIENIVMNNMQGYIEATNLAVTSNFGMGRLYIHALTKGGAYNHFFLNTSEGRETQTNLLRSVPMAQLQIGISLDFLVNKFNYQCPTHIKIDVDGNETDIIAGMTEVLQNKRCKSILIELHHNDPKSLAIVEKFNEFRFHCVSERSNWESRAYRQREPEHPATNMIFERLK